MIRIAVARYWFPASVAAMLTAIVVLAAFLLVVAVPDLSRQAAAEAPTPTPAPSTAATANPLSPMANSPIGIQMSANADCAACHETTDGTVGTKDIPVMAHPLWGWRDCTACHSTGSLVATAPGHSGLHKDDCLVCHKAPDPDATTTHAPLRPEHMGNTQPCTSCHGVDDHAPLPASMADRGDNCWICHNGPEFTYLFDSDASPSSDSDASPSPTPPPSTNPASGEG